MGERRERRNEVEEDEEGHEDGRVGEGIGHHEGEFQPADPRLAIELHNVAQEIPTSDETSLDWVGKLGKNVLDAIVGSRPNQFIVCIP